MTRVEVATLDVGDKIKYAHTETKFLRDSIWKITKIDEVGVHAFGETIPTPDFIPYDQLRREFEKA